MDKDFIENNNLEKILKNYLKQENMTINSLSKESKIKLETIKKILENNDLMIVEYYNKDSIKSEDSHPYIYVFSYYYTIDDDFIFGYYSQKKDLYSRKNEEVSNE